MRILITGGTGLIGQVLTRFCILRTGIVLDEKGGALSKMLPAFRLDSALKQLLD